MNAAERPAPWEQVGLVRWIAEEDWAGVDRVVLVAELRAALGEADDVEVILREPRDWGEMAQEEYGAPSFRAGSIAVKGRRVAASGAAPVG